MYDELWKILLKDPDYNDYAKLKKEFDWPRIKTAKRNQDIQNFFSKRRQLTWRWAATWWCGARAA